MTSPLVALRLRPFTETQSSGREKVYLGIRAPRCQVQRLMRQAGLHGARRGKAFITTKPDKAAARPPDLVNRDFTAERPNLLWLVDFERHEALSNRVGVGDLHRRAVAAAG